MTLMTGCVLGRRTVDLAVPSLPAGEPNGISVTVKPPSDARTFENKPSDPSTPSIDGDVNSLTKDEQLLMIGRQRNGYGMAMGDVALPVDETITQKMQQLVIEGLEARGYRVEGEGGDYQVEVKVEEFWGWFTPGMFVVTFEARLKSNIELSKGSEREILTVTGHGVNRGQVASDANWQLAYKRAFEDFLKNLEAALEERGL